MWHTVEHAFFDTLKIFPFLLAIFILLAVFEHYVSSQKYARLLGGKFAPLVGSVTGVIPQCGISVMAVKLFQERCITIGTLLAIFISTSDEAVTVLLSNGMWKEFLCLVGIKAVVAIAVGYLADAVLKKESLRFSSGYEDSYAGDCYGCCHHAEGKGKWYTFFIHPLLHCLKTAGYILAVNVALGLIIYFVGEDKFGAFMADTGYFQPFVASLVGLIPNCASSVAIVEVFVAGNLTFGGLVAGLVSNAGIGLALMFRDGKHAGRNLLIVFILYFSGVIVGEIITLLTAVI